MDAEPDSDSVYGSEDLLRVSRLPYKAVMNVVRILQIASGLRVFEIKYPLW